MKKPEEMSPDERKEFHAFEKAWEVRTFEIGLYWKRATYFWGFNIAAFTGYSALLAAEDSSNELLFPKYIIVLVGIAVSYGWFLCNRGSKFWQENWEYHIELKEDDYTGPLYKTVLHKDKAVCFSVSDVNLWISLFFQFVWLFISAHHLLTGEDNKLYMLLSLIAVLAFCAFLHMNTRRLYRDSEPVKRRENSSNGIYNHMRNKPVVEGQSIRSKFTVSFCLTNIGFLLSLLSTLIAFLGVF